jgi:hypothetical protein
MREVGDGIVYGSHLQSEGLFLTVVDADREWVAASGFAVRAAAGTSVANPRFD